MDAESAFNELRVHDGRGIMTSTGRLFNHTIFSRDVCMIGRWILDLGPSYWPVSHDIIMTVASHQATASSRLSEAAPGQIHNEFKLINDWQAPLAIKLINRLVAKAWGGSFGVEQTYFGLDTTPLFILLVCDYAETVDPDILSEAVGDGRTVGQALQAALDWIHDSTDAEGFINRPRRNPFGLFYRTWKDSHLAYAHESGRLADLRSLVYLDVQVLCIDALRQAANLLEEPRHSQLATDLTRLTLSRFWSHLDNYFWTALEADGPLTMPGSNAGWMLDSTIFDHLDQDERRMYVTGIIHRLFSEEFLTSVGVRARGRGSDAKLGVIGYHSSGTSWPVDTYMLLRGLRRHGFYRLASALAERLQYGYEASQGFPEFFFVLDDGRLNSLPEWYLPVPHRMVQIMPEQNLGWSIAAALCLDQTSYACANVPGWVDQYDSELSASLPEPGRTSYLFRPSPILGACKTAAISFRELGQQYILHK